MYYVISLYHTQKYEEHITLWQPDNKGYCHSKEMAGLYESPQEGYHNSNMNLAVPEDVINPIFEKCKIEGKEAYAIPNKLSTWEKLGIYYTKKRRLERLNPYVPQIQI